MTAAKLVEYSISRQLVRRNARCGAAHNTERAQLAGVSLMTIQPWAERLIAVLAATAGLAVVGSFVEELLWLVVAVATVITLK